MSDDDFMDDDYDFEYEESGAESEADVDAENRYYNAKARKEDDVDGALGDFRQLLNAEAESMTEWGFRAAKQVVKLLAGLNRLDEALEAYRRALAYTTQCAAITRNYAEKSVGNLLDVLSGAHDVAFLERVYETTLDALKQANNERLWIKTNLKLAKLYLDRKQYVPLTRLLKTLREMCEAEAPAPQVATMQGDDFQRKGTHLLEIYALEIQMYTQTKNNKRLKALYQQCLMVKSAIPHPRIMGVIRECGGKMHMQEKSWVQAQQDFFEAFKNYEEAGSSHRVQCLKYLVLASMLSESVINPFDSQETKPYKNDPQIVAMTNLVAAYQCQDIRAFEKILQDNRATIMDDGFIRMYIEDLLRGIRSNVVVRLIQPYRRISLDFIASQLGTGLSVDEVEALLIVLILDGRIDGRIDQLRCLLEMPNKVATDKHASYLYVQQWSEGVSNLVRHSLRQLC